MFENVFFIRLQKYMQIFLKRKQDQEQNIVDKRFVSVHALIQILWLSVRLHHLSDRTQSSAFPDKLDTRESELNQLALLK